MMLEENLSYIVRGCVYEVYKQLGCGFLEKVYEKALLTELALPLIEWVNQSMARLLAE